MRLSLRFLILTVALPVFLFSCKGTRPVSGNTATGTGDPSAQKKRQAENLFIDASTAWITGNAKEAFGLFQQCLSIDPKNHAALYNLGRIAYESGDFRTAVQYGKEALKLDNGNFWYYALLSDAYERTGDLNETAGILEQIIRKFPDHYQSFMNLAHVYTLQRRYPEALKALNSLENNVGLSEEVAYKKLGIYMETGELEKALTESGKLIDLSPDNGEYYQARYEVLMELGRENDAIAVLEKLYEADHNSGFALFSLADHYRKKGDVAKSDSYLFEAFRNPYLELNGKLQILAGIYDEMNGDSKATQRADSLSSILVRVHPADASVLGARGSFFLASGKTDSAVAFFRNSIQDDPTSESAWMQLLDIEAEAGDFPGLKKDSEKALEYFPDHLVFLYYFGIGASQTGDAESAVYAFEKIRKIASAPADMKLRACIELGSLYHKQKNFARSDENFNEALRLSPDDPTVLNNYAYFLSLRGERLDEAEKMSAKSLRLMPGSSSYQDTYGWILFVKGDYKGAEEWVGKALQQSPSSEVLEHYGDIQEKLGDMNRALEYWNRSREAGNDSQELAGKIQRAKTK